jgi:hypothetical protein
LLDNQKRLFLLPLKLKNLMSKSLTKALALLLIVVGLTANAQINCPVFFGDMGGSDQSVCPGATVNLTLSPSAWDVSGGAITYQWY